MTMSEMHSLRHFLLENSATTAFVQESMPPMPRPVIMRQMESWTGLAEYVDMNMPKIIVSTQRSNVGRPPYRSASPARNTEPMAMPISSMERTWERSAVATLHALAMPLPAKAIDRGS